MSYWYRNLTPEEYDRALAESVPGEPGDYPTETMYCVGRPGQMTSHLVEDGERLVAMGYLRLAPEVDPPRRWFALADGVTKAMVDAAERQMLVDYPRRSVPSGDGFEVVFDPPAAPTNGAAGEAARRRPRPRMG